MKFRVCRADKWVFDKQILAFLKSNWKSVVSWYVDEVPTCLQNSWINNEFIRCFWISSNAISVACCWIFNLFSSRRMTYCQIKSFILLFSISILKTEHMRKHVGDLKFKKGNNNVRDGYCIIPYHKCSVCLVLIFIYFNLK